MTEKTTAGGRLPGSMDRRAFIKLCATATAALGLGPSWAPKLAQALTDPARPPILWLHMAECTGCTEAALRATGPWFGDLILDTVSLDYHETLMAASGKTVEDILFQAAQEYEGRFLCVVEGAIPTAQNGVFGMVGGRTMLQTARDICPKAAGVVAIGTCASFGGLPAASPNPTGAKGVGAALGGLLSSVPLINISGCPPNPVNLVATLANYLLLGNLPSVDANKRPTFAYGRRVHDLCPYRRDPYEDLYCLEDKGCKGKRCYNNCPQERFNLGRSFPMMAGHPCIGCAEPGFWDTMTPFYREEGDDDDD